MSLRIDACVVMLRNRRSPQRHATLPQEALIKCGWGFARAHWHVERSCFVHAPESVVAGLIEVNHPYRSPPFVGEIRFSPRRVVVRVGVFARVYLERSVKLLRFNLDSAIRCD